MTRPIVGREADYTYVDKSTGRPATFAPKPDEAMVTFHESPTQDEVDELVASVPQLSVSEGVNLQRGYAAVLVDPGEDLDAVATAAEGGPAIANSIPVLVDENGASRYFVPDELTVQFKPEVDAERAYEAIAELGSAVVREQRTPGYYTVSVPPGQALFATIRDFSALDVVAFAEPSEVSFNSALPYLPDDADFGELWGLNNTGQTVNGAVGTADADIDVTDAWDRTRGDPEVIAAVIDTGADLGHVDLQGNILPRGAEDWDFADGGDPSPQDEAANSHGTHVSGTIAAVDDANGVIGVAPGCRVMPLRVDLTAGANQNRADAINYVSAQATANPGRRYVINCSWRMNGDHAGVRTAIQNAVNNNVVVVFAAGNDNVNTDGSPQFPGVYPEVIAVAALDQQDRRAGFSNFGANVDVAAPGVNIWSTTRNGNHGFLNGTSMAAPHVAGVAALVWSVNRTLTNHQVRRIIENTCDNVDAGNPGFQGLLGRGRVNAHRAVLMADTAASQHTFDNSIALVRQVPGWSTIPVAFARGDGNWDIVNGAAPSFIGSWANTPGVQVVTGDFSGNGLTDIALVRQLAGWSTIPVAFARGDGSWDITNGAAPSFIGSWANTPGVQVVTGDFNGNGLTDVALVRQHPGWSTIPVAFARGDGSWDITNGAAPSFIGSWANTPGARIVTGDFNGNGLTDVALVRQTPGWSTIPIAFARGDGNWDITNGAAPSFIGSWANTPGVTVVTGDFNRNGLTDVALVRQTPGWSTIPIAFARGDGNWDITNGAAPSFIGSWANTPGVTVVTGDFNRNGLTDVALVRQTPGWSTIPIAFARGDGNWDITNGAAPSFIGSWANTPGVTVVTGDFNRNGLTDVALVRQTPGWSTIPVASARGDGNWDVTNGAAPNFIGSWANTPGVAVTAGSYR